MAAHASRPDGLRSPPEWPCFLVHVAGAVRSITGESASYRAERKSPLSNNLADLGGHRSENRCRYRIGREDPGRAAPAEDVLEGVSRRIGWERWSPLDLLMAASAAPPRPSLLAKDHEINLSLAHRMLSEQPRGSLVEIPEAGHDLHLDNPAAWRDALEAFL
jgi:pimeloyl-ACP methyl ester carboxylesterase